jgi:hypothetical protein
MFLKTVTVYEGATADEPRLAIKIVPRSMGTNQQLDRLIFAWMRLDGWHEMSDGTRDQYMSVAVMFSQTVEAVINPAGEDDRHANAFAALWDVARKCRQGDVIEFSNFKAPGHWDFDNDKPKMLFDAVGHFLFTDLYLDWIRAYNKASVISEPDKLFVSPDKLEPDEQSDEELEKKDETPAES